jgi:hypothetical protein
MQNQPTENYITESIFRHELQAVADRLDQKINYVSKELLNTMSSLDKKMDNSTTTLGEKMDRMTDRMDFLFKKMSEFDQEETVQSVQLQETRQQVAGHETRLTKLESPQ